MLSSYFILISLCVIINVCIIDFSDCAIPDFIQVCHQNDPDLSGCIKNSIEALKPRLKAGIKELDVPPLEPFYLDRIRIDSVAESSYLGTNLTNIEAFGASNFNITRIVSTVTKKGYIFQFDTTIPNMQIRGNYAMNTRILFLPIIGNGTFTSNISDYDFSCILKGNRIKRNEDNYLHFDRMKCKLNVGKVSIYLHNLFNGNVLLGQATNAAINDNIDLFFEEMKPNIADAVTKRFTDIANKITLTFKYDELFP